VDRAIPLEDQVGDLKTPLSPAQFAALSRMSDTADVPY
jgi:hypothetical protein